MLAQTALGIARRGQFLGGRNGWYWQPLPVDAAIPAVWAEMLLAQCCVPVTKRTGIKPSEVISSRNFSILWTCVHFVCQGVPHWAVTSKRSHFSASLSPPFMFFVSTLSFLGAVHQCCVSAVCWGQAAFIFVLQLEADRGVPLWSDLPVWGWKALRCYSGVMDHFWAAPSVCFRKRLMYLQHRRFSFSHALQHSQGRRVQVNKILKLIFWTVFSLCTTLPPPSAAGYRQEKIRQG